MDEVAEQVSLRRDDDRPHLLRLPDEPGHPAGPAHGCRHRQTLAGRGVGDREDRAVALDDLDPPPVLVDRRHRPTPARLRKPGRGARAPARRREGRATATGTRAPPAPRSRQRRAASAPRVPTSAPSACAPTPGVRVSSRARRGKGSHPKGAKLPRSHGRSELAAVVGRGLRPGRHWGGPCARRTVAWWASPSWSSQSRRTYVPGDRTMSRLVRLDGEVTVRPPTAVITSPAARPARSAGALGVTAVTKAPCGDAGRKPEGWMLTPRKAVGPMWSVAVDRPAETRSAIRTARLS